MGEDLRRASDPTTRWALDRTEVERLLLHLVASGPRTVTPRAPFTGALLAELPRSTGGDVAVAVERARTAQGAWAARPLGERVEVLLRLHDLVLDRQDEGLDLLQLENGKARASAYEEVADIALVARHYARAAHRYLAPRRVPALLPGLSTAFVLRHPIGVVGVIAPFNYPLVLSLGDALPALLAGNAVVVKPDEQTTLTALWGAELLAAAGLPADLMLVVSGDGPTVGGALVGAVDHVVFTGSTRTGRVVASAAGERLVGATLELGGKNALYVAADADPAVAAEGAVRASFASTGQLCVSMERLVVHEAVADAFLDELLPRVRALRLGPGLDFSADVGSLTNAAQLARVQEHVDEAVREGARVLVGGRHRPDIGPHFYEPTVLDGVSPHSPVFADETFGPVVAIHRVPDDDAAVALINDSVFGLNASIWTRDVARGRRLAARVEAGSVNVNEGYALAWGTTAAPSGGVKDSGLGRRHGAEGIWATTWTQTVAVQHGAHHGLGLRRLYALPAKRWTALFTGALRLMKLLRVP